MIPNTHYDYIIVGNGLAGLQLALAISKDSYFKDKQIALIDPSTKTANDKTWSFWETENKNWDAITYQKWKKANVIFNTKKINLNLVPYTYKTIRAIDFYTEAKTQIKQQGNIHFIIENVTSISEHKTVSVTTDSNTYTADHVFDSRITEETKSKLPNYITITQHFKGWVIETETDCFEEDTVTMMDYRLRDGNQTTFNYVLPFSKREALVEFTYFTKQLVDEHVYDSFLKQYIQEYLKIENYKIIETEMGQIPMTNYPFEKHNTNKITKIGTAGGWVKGSTGYSFKHTEKKVNQIISNLKSNQVPSKDLFKSKYAFYDKIFLKVLKDENHKGEWIFKQFYSKNSIQTMFRFLDEESTFKEELNIMWSLFSWSFIKAFFKTL
ncbi:lycopene cyclase family protein [Olleya sp. YS]|uniref:lycopene cyclase family protein n=1 Tax=Olleya sp. YS TaxID=3028318 RepID=UPI002434165F|nr:lycopene cyclase family protein [Olleya sp. YS]WGD34098.1 lycopene cyclase family protein [Olleya sp. YS]